MKTFAIFLTFTLASILNALEDAFPLPDGIYQANYIETIKKTLTSPRSQNATLADPKEVEMLGKLYSGFDKLVKLNGSVHLLHGQNINMDELPEVEVFIPEKFVADTKKNGVISGVASGKIKMMYEIEKHQMSRNFEIISFDGARLVIRYGTNGNGDTVFGVYDYKKLRQ